MACGRGEVYTRANRVASNTSWSFILDWERKRRKLSVLAWALTMAEKLSCLNKLELVPFESERNIPNYVHMRELTRCLIAHNISIQKKIHIPTELLLVHNRIDSDSSASRRAVIFMSCRRR
uniref:(northern house mosquito) hypothetical protein n=1 Tax=Culex pipiens TaxID=7175 RepID=A0A8D8F038_CULPI